MVKELNLSRVEVVNATYESDLTGINQIPQNRTLLADLLEHMMNIQLRNFLDEFASVTAMPGIFSLASVTLGWILASKPVRWPN